MNSTTLSVHSSPATPPRHQHVSAFDSPSSFTRPQIIMATAGEAVSIDAFHEVLASFGYGPSPADEDDCSSEQVNGLNDVTEETDGVEVVGSGSSRVQTDGVMSLFSSVSWTSTSME